MNVIRTVRDFEAFGVSGIYMEDQVTPKRCGLLPNGIPVISKEDQVIKLKAAVDARKSKEFMIIARTDAKSMYGLEEATSRARAYIEAGADAALVMGANSPDELRYVASIVQAPLVTVIQETPPTTELTDELLNEVGCTIAMHAGIARYAVVRALKDVFSALHNEGHTRSVQSKMATFDEYNQALELERWLGIEEHYLSQSK
jgi:methylisocitrate lyase